MAKIYIHAMLFYLIEQFSICCHGNNLTMYHNLFNTSCVHTIQKTKIQKCEHAILIKNLQCKIIKEVANVKTIKK